MARSQNAPRGLFGKQRIDLNSGGSFYAHGYSSSTSLLSADSTGLQVAGGVKLSRKANAVISGDSTGMVVVGAIKVANKANGLVNANSTGLRLIAAVFSGTSRLLAANSTGIKIGARYISTNVTGNLVT